MKRLGIFRSLNASLDWDGKEAVLFPFEAK